MNREKNGGRRAEMKGEERIGDLRTRWKKEVTGDRGKQRKQRIRGQDTQGKER